VNESTVPGIMTFNPSGNPTAMSQGHHLGSESKRMNCRRRIAWPNVTPAGKVHSGSFQCRALLNAGKPVCKVSMFSVHFYANGLAKL
jgi:hypothetical protein